MWERETRQLPSGFRSGTKASWVTNNTVANRTAAVPSGTSLSSSIRLWLCQHVKRSAQNGSVSREEQLVELKTRVNTE